MKGEFWYGYIKERYENKAQLCYIDTDSFIILIKTDDFYQDMTKVVEKRFDTSNYEVERPLKISKNKYLFWYDEIIGC